jgi:hypothetical protein
MIMPASQNRSNYAFHCGFLRLVTKPTAKSGFSDPKEFNKVFTELGFSYVEDDCGGNCIKCKKKDNCETYTEIKNIFKHGGSD